MKEISKTCIYCRSSTLIGKDHECVDPRNSYTKINNKVSYLIISVFLVWLCGIIKVFFANLPFSSSVCGLILIFAFCYLGRKSIEFEENTILFGWRDRGEIRFFKILFVLSILSFPFFNNIYSFYFTEMIQQEKYLAVVIFSNVFFAGFIMCMLEPNYKTATKFIKYAIFTLRVAQNNRKIEDACDILEKKLIDSFYVYQKMNWRDFEKTGDTEFALIEIKKILINEIQMKINKKNIEHHQFELDRAVLYIDTQIRRIKKT